MQPSGPAPDERQGWGAWLGEKWQQTKAITTEVVLPAVSQITNDVVVPYLVAGAQKLYAGGQKLYDITANVIVPGVAHGASVAYTAANVAAKIIPNWNGVVDAEDSIQNLDIDQRIKDTYHHVQPALLQPFYDRFGVQSMLDLHIFAKYARKQLPEQLGGGWIANLTDQWLGDTIQIDLQTLAMGSITWICDKLRAAIPTKTSEASKSAFAAGVSQDMQQAMDQIGEVAHNLRKKKRDWGQPGFVDDFNASLATTHLSKSLGDPKTFYINLADRILKKMESEESDHIAKPLADMIKTACSTIDQFKPHAQRDFLAGLLMQLHQQITDPDRLKGWLMQIIDISSGALDSKFQAFVDNDLLVSDAPPIPYPHAYDKAYGKTIMGLLQTLQPRAWNMNVLGTYSYFTAKSIKVGDDFLSVLLRNSTGWGIEEFMSPDTDKWIISAVKLTRESLFDQRGDLIPCPGHVPPEDWLRLSPEEKLEVINTETPLGREFKSRHVEKIDNSFRDSCERIAKSVFRAGLVVEQFLSHPQQVADDPSKNIFSRLINQLIALYLQIPGTHTLHRWLHYFHVWIRVKIADASSIKTGESLANRVEELLQTNAIPMLAMHMVERSLLRLAMIDENTGPAGATTFDAATDLETLSTDSEESTPVKPISEDPLRQIDPDEFPTIEDIDDDPTIEDINGR